MSEDLSQPFEKVFRRAILEAASRHGARSVRVFGSAARGTHTEGSDLDLLVEFEPERDLFDLIELKDELEEALGRSVDVVTTGSLSPHIREKVLNEAIPL